MIIAYVSLSYQMSFQCPYCHKTRPTAQGLKKHITPSAICRNAQEVEYVKRRQQLNLCHGPQLEGPDTSMHNEEIATWEDEVFVSLDLDMEMTDMAGPAGSRNSSVSPGPVASSLNPNVHPEIHNSENSSKETSSLHHILFPQPAGTRKDRCTTHYEELFKSRKALECSRFHPFADQEEWELARTLMTSGMSLSAIDQLLKLSIVCVLC
jgi:hypothetical protein